jgi:hypothetical protein
VVSKGHSSHEREHARRSETDFKTLARRNKLLGLWAAEKLGMHGDAAEAYSKDVIYADLEEPGEDDIIRKVLADFERHGQPITRKELEHKLVDCLVEARRQLDIT